MTYCSYISNPSYEAYIIAYSYLQAQLYLDNKHHKDFVVVENNKILRWLLENGTNASKALH